MERRGHENEPVGSKDRNLQSRTCPKLEDCPKTMLSSSGGEELSRKSKD